MAIKLGGIVCDRCKVFMPHPAKIVLIKGKTKDLHYCTKCAIRTD